MLGVPKLVLLLIGSGLDDLVITFEKKRPVVPRVHIGYEMPPEGILLSVDCALVFEVDQQRRFEQLQYLCRQRRSNGYVKTVIAYSRKLDTQLAAAVEAAGARFVTLPGGKR